MNKFLSWLIWSSENPNNISLTLKGIFGTITTIVLLISPIAHLSVEKDQLNAVADALIQAVLSFFSLVSIIMTVVGVVRKINLHGSNPTELQTNPKLTPIDGEPINPPVDNVN